MKETLLSSEPEHLHILVSKLKMKLSKLRNKFKNLVEKSSFKILILTQFLTQTDI